jgi:aspartokinase-like uncharacterized kinase
LFLIGIGYKEQFIEITNAIRAVDKKPVILPRGSGFANLIRG